MHRKFTFCLTLLACISLKLTTTTGSLISEALFRCRPVNTRIVHKHNEAAFLCWRGGGCDQGVYTFEAKDVAPERQLLKPEMYELDCAALENAAPLLRDAVSDHMRAVRTNGNGACGIHALCGSPAPAHEGGDELFFRNARVWAIQQVGPSLENLEQHPELEAHVRAIKTILWTEFVVNRFEGRRTSEGDIFWKLLQVREPGLACEAQDIISANRTAKPMYEAAKTAAKVASRTFFQMERG